MPPQIRPCADEAARIARGGARIARRKSPPRQGQIACGSHESRGAEVAESCCATEDTEDIGRRGYRARATGKPALFVCLGRRRRRRLGEQAIRVDFLAQYLLVQLAVLLVAVLVEVEQLGAALAWFRRREINICRPGTVAGACTLTDAAVPVGGNPRAARETGTAQTGGERSDRAMTNYPVEFHRRSERQWARRAQASRSSELRSSGSSCRALAHPRM